MFLCYFFYENVPRLGAKIGANISSDQNTIYIFYYTDLLLLLSASASSCSIFLNTCVSFKYIFRTVKFVGHNVKNSHLCLLCSERNFCTTPVLPSNILQRHPITTTKTCIFQVLLHYHTSHELLK